MDWIQGLTDLCWLGPACKADWLAWTAIGTVASAGFAVGFAIFTAVRTRKERKATALALAYSILHDLVAIAGKVDEFDAFTGYTDDPEEDLDIDAVRAIFVLPEDLRRASQRLSDFGDFRTEVQAIYADMASGLSLWDARSIRRQMNDNSPPQSTEIRKLMARLDKRTRELAVRIGGNQGMQPH